MNYGFIKSKIDGTEKKFDVVEGLDVPEEYSYVKYLPKVLNQGDESICVPCSLSAHLNWNYNVDTDGKNDRDNKIKLHDIYNIREHKDLEGMTFKEAFKFLRNTGVKSNSGIMKIGIYAMVGGKEQIKQALLLNGPLVGALPVYNSSNEFWKQRNGDKYCGGHAISIVGYNKEGLMIRNSWGESFGNKGYSLLKWEDLSTFYEIWTIVD